MIKKLTADELAAEGRRLMEKGHMVVYLYPSQEFMAVDMQTPFLRYVEMKEMK